MQVPSDGSIGTLIVSDGVQYIGIISLSDGWWIAVRVDDDGAIVRLVKEDT